MLFVPESISDIWVSNLPKIAQTVRGTARNLSHKLYKPRDNAEADSCYIYSSTDMRKGNRHFLWLLSRSLDVDAFFDFTV